MQPTNFEIAHVKSRPTSKQNVYDPGSHKMNTKLKIKNPMK